MSFNYTEVKYNASLINSKHLIIDGKEVNINNLNIVRKVTHDLKKILRLKSTVKQVNKLLKNLIQNGEYLGLCFPVGSQVSGYLVKNGDLYIVLNTKLTHITQITTDPNKVPLITNESDNHTIVINGKEFDISNIELSSHFIKQASERFKVPEESIKSLLFDIVLNGQYVCVTHCNVNQKPAHLFCKENKLVYLSLDLTTAITTYYKQIDVHRIHPNVKEKMKSFLLNEINELSQIEASLLQKIEQENNKGEASLLDQITELKKEWLAIVTEIRRHAVALSAFV